MSQSTGMAQEQVLGKAYDLRLIKALWRFVRPHARLLLLWGCLVPITISFELAQPYVLKVAIVDHIAVGNGDGLEWLALAFIGLVALQAASGFAEQLVLNLVGQRSMHGMRLAIYDHVLRQRAAFFDRMPVGRLLTRMTNDIESINEVFAQGVISALADAVKMVAILAIMLSLDVSLTLMTFLTFPLLILLVNYSRRAMRHSFREIRVRLAAMNAFVQEHLSGIRVVQLFRREPAARREYDEINAGHRDAYLSSIRADAAMYALVEAIGVMAIAGIAWWASQRLGTGASALAQVGLVVVFIEYVNKFFLPVRDLSAKYAVMQGAMAATERIVQLLDTDEPDCPVGAPEPAQIGAPLVVFDGVRFAYGAGEPVLRGVSFEIPRGSTVAVVGATGSGKSTLIKLLTRLYERDAGVIRVDGRDVRELTPAALRRRVTVVTQDVFLFEGTVADNVAMGAGVDGAALSRDKIAEAIKRVGADRLLARRAPTPAEQSEASGVGATPASPVGRGRSPLGLDEAMDSKIAERGANFSAGERQLLAFARAMARDPEILVLDEATAHVDPEAEELIEKGVAELMRGRTTLVIAHRLSTIRNADLILVMNRGEVVERGTHDELVAAGGIYAQLERTFRRSGH